MLKKFLFFLAIGSFGVALAQEAAAPAAPPAEGAPKPPPAAEARQPRPRGGERNLNRSIGNNDLFVERMRIISEKLFQKYDVDGDGTLDEAEKAALQKDLTTVEEFLAIGNIFQIRQLQAADSDGDFKLSDEEIEKLDMQKIRESTMPRNRSQAPGRRDADQGGGRPNRGGGRQRGPAAPVPAPAPAPEAPEAAK